MFSKSKINEPASQSDKTAKPEAGSASMNKAPMEKSEAANALAKSGQVAKTKPPASLISSDLQLTGNVKTSGDIMVEGNMDGDIRAHLLNVGQGATVKGEVVADDVVINGRIQGRVRGLKVRLTSTAVVEGDIIHKTLAIESGAHFQGSVQRQDDPLSSKGSHQTKTPSSAVGKFGAGGPGK
ncbi:MAG: polymer-forming cytoskeletal protein [Roseovarius sp.]|nr:polymer-forming cytoskeletal protein [Roseovarius sp.]MCY4208129.1 polymer-forming cytoskeletal protein [Roseovarius sp.]MCY4292134.1 polymer-forming cytoskeletal protein [Roseovarius sp.]MCY4317112.1 polymer-forming cytoskeletal protein [Roseovarius sp.]